MYYILGVNNNLMYIIGLNQTLFNIPSSKFVCQGSLTFFCEYSLCFKLSIGNHYHDPG